MSRQSAINRARENERTISNNILERGKDDYRQQLAVIVSSVFVFIFH